MLRIVLILSSILSLAICDGQAIKMEKVGRAYQVPCSVNGLSLKFILDTGASDVSISLSEALFMLKNGYLNEGELLNTEEYKLANGELVDGTRVILRSMVIGGLVIKNIEASVIHTLDAPLLLGQSALEKLGKVTIDYKNDLLIVNENQEVYATPKGSWTDFFIKGFEKAESGNLRGAIDDYNIAIGINPKNSKAYFNRGIAKHKLGNYNGAIEDFNKSIELDSNFSRFYVNRGATKVLLRDYEGAVMDFNKAIELNPKDSKAYFNRGVVKNKLGDYLGSMGDFNKAIEFNPNYTNAYYQRGIRKAVLKDHKGAIEDYNKAIALNASFSDALYKRGVSKSAIGDYKGALADYNGAIAKNSNLGDAYLGRGLVKVMLNDTNEGCIDIAKAVSLGVSDAVKVQKDICE